MLLRKRPATGCGEDASVTDTSKEIVVSVLKRMGYELNVRLLPWNRAYQHAASGHAAILFTFRRNTQREEQFFFTDGLASIEVVLFKRKSDQIAWPELNDVKNLRIGYVDGCNDGNTMMEAIRGNVFAQTGVIGASAMVDYQQLHKSASKRIDIAVCPKTQCNRIIRMKAPELDELDFIDKSIGSSLKKAARPSFLTNTVSTNNPPTPFLAEEILVADKHPAGRFFRIDLWPSTHTSEDLAAK
jgi:hypothetical protein